MTDLRPALIASLCVLVFLAAGLPAHAQDQGAGGDGDLRISDAKGDAGLAPAMLDTPAQMLHQHVDIVEVGFGNEAVDTLDIWVRFAGHDDNVRTVAEALAATDMVCRLDWTYVGLDDTWYRIQFWGSELTPDAEPGILSELSFRHYGDRRGNWDYTRAGHTHTWDPATATFTFTVQKDFIPTFPGARAPAIGDRLEFDWGNCFSDVGLFFSYWDTVQGEGQYAFKTPGAGEVVRIGFGDEAAGDITTWQFPDGDAANVRPIATDRTNLVPLTLANAQDDKQLVALEIDADVPSGWNVSLSPSVLLKPREHRTINLVVIPAAGAQIGDGADITVTGTVASDGSTGTATARLEIRPTLGLDAPSIHFHAREVPQAPPRDLITSQYELQADLEAERDGWDESPVQPTLLSDVFMWDTFDAIAYPVGVDVAEAGTLEFEVVGDAGARLYVEFAAWQGDSSLYYADGEFEVGKHEISLYSSREDDLSLEPGDELDFWMWAGAPFGATQAGLDLSAARLTLPLTEEEGVQVSDGRYMPRIDLGSGESRITYTNPGKEYAFDLVLANDGIETDDIQIQLSTENATGWDIKALPGDRYRVPAGESTPVTIDVIAPADANEQDAAIITVEAVSKNDPDAVATITLKAIITNNELEEKTYEEKDDQLPPIEEAQEGAPAPAALLFVACLFGALVWTRRRG